MSKKLNTNLEKGEWVKDEDGSEFLFRPYPISHIPANVTQKELELKMFKHCIVDWKGMVDEDTDEDIPCNDETKLYVFNYFQDVSEFMGKYLVKKMKLEKEEEKN